MFTKHDFLASRGALSLALVCILVQSLAPESIQLLRYQSNAVNAGEWWRIISANICHSNWNHLGLNLAGLLMIDYLYQPMLSQKNRMALLGFCIAVNVLLLHWFVPLNWYVGLSGALHGFLIGCALLSFKQAKLLNSLVLLVVSAKLFVELNWEINATTAGFIEANVVEEAHLAGAISAVIYSIPVILWRHFHSGPKRRRPE